MGIPVGIYRESERRGGDGEKWVKKNGCSVGSGTAVEWAYVRGINGCRLS